MAQLHFVVNLQLLEGREETQLPNVWEVVHQLLNVWEEANVWEEVRLVPQQ